MGIDSEAKPELYQQTLGSSRRWRQGAGPMPWSVAVPSQQHWDTVALPQPSPADPTCPGPVHSPCPARRTCQEGKHQLPTSGCSQRATPWQEQEGWTYCWCWPALVEPPHGPSHSSSWQEPWASRGFDCNRMSHSFTQMRGSEMFSQDSFQGNSVLLHRPCTSFPASQREGRDSPHNQNICSYLKPVTAIPRLEATLTANS